MCPNYLDYEVAVLQSNIAACHLKLEEWKEVIKSATDAISGLDKLEEAEKEKEKEKEKETEETSGPTAKKVAEEQVDAEIVSAGALKAAPAPAPSRKETEAEAALRRRREDVLRIRGKALMRRARARSELGGWSDLAGAEEDYKALSTMTNLSMADMRLVMMQLRVLPPRTKAAQEKETAEMWGKLKEVRGPTFSPLSTWRVRHG